MSYTRILSDPSYLFTLRFKLSTGWVTMRAWESANGCAGPQSRLDCELLHNGKVIFPRGATWCGVSPLHSIDGNDARELVCSLFALKPGDTDAEYFASYTPEQLAWAEQNGEELSMLSRDRYCDKNGNVRKTA